VSKASRLSKNPIAILAQHSNSRRYHIHWQQYGVNLGFCDSSVLQLRYGLDSQRIGVGFVGFHARARDLPLLHDVQTSFGAHLASCTVGYTGGVDCKHFLVLCCRTSDIIIFSYRSSDKKLQLLTYSPPPHYKYVLRVISLFFTFTNSQLF
jgi:hypothetical protein